MKEKVLYLLVILFAIFLIAFFIFEKEYIHNADTNYINTLKQEIKFLINNKRISTLEIAKNLSIDKKLIYIIKTNQYNLLYNSHFFAIAGKYENFKNVAIHIIDKNGIQRYISWSKKSLGKNILKARPDISEFLKNPKPQAIISSGLFDITFKGMVPIYDSKHHFLAILEVITHFNSIVLQLKRQEIYSAIILNKEKSKNIKYNLFGEFINNYFITNKLNPKIKEIFIKNGIHKFINTNPDEYSYLVQDDDLFDGYFILNTPIKEKNKVIANYICFVKDKYKIRESEVFLRSIMIIISLLFIGMTILAYKETKEKRKLINSLNNEIENQINEKLSIIYEDSLTKSYKKTKFEIDRVDFLNYEVIMLNIKNFSKINEFYGFKTGDKVLEIVVKRIEKLLNSKIYRINADEFVFFSKNIKQDIKQIRELFIIDPIKISKENIKIRLSFSFSVVKNNGSEILRKLSIALKEAKNEPFNDFVYYKEKPIHNDFIKFNAILYDAIFIREKAEIIPYFQGIRDNNKGVIKKYECLARLKTDKIYSPFFFIDIAKNSGFLLEITKIMIDKSFKYLTTKDNDIEISINITEDDLLTYQLKNYLLDKLNEYNLKAQRVTLEILEGITSGGTKQNIEQLKELKELGFKLAIDDFGVEYSNFERINELDIDFIKIDGKYIKNLNISNKSYEIAKAITDFAHSLNIKVVAEFVENEEIQKIVDELRIEYTQGYYFSQPKKDMLE